MWQLSQRVTKSYYKVWKVLQNVTVITKWDAAKVKHSITSALKNSFSEKLQKSHRKIYLMEFNFVEVVSYNFTKLVIHSRFYTVNFEKFFISLFVESFSLFKASSKQLHCFSNTLWRLPLCNPLKTVNTQLNKQIKKISLQVIVQWCFRNIHDK